jgi:hypothetical protein
VGRAAYKPGGVSALSENVGEQVTKALQEAGKAVDS